MNDDNELLDEEDDDQFPWEDVEAARQDRRLQREHPVAESQQLYPPEPSRVRNATPPPAELSWFYFESPKEFWAQLCGCGGWMTVWTITHLQVDFFREMIS